MDHEDFANLCLRIKNHDTKLTIPCCANCEYYIRRQNNKYKCYHPMLKSEVDYDQILRVKNDIMTGSAWIETKPEDFCNYFKESRRWN